MANFNQSLNEAVCIDEEIFFGPITDKEKKIRQHFEKKCRNENRVGESSVVENDISKNDSLYKSFTNDGSKYDSFDDSLNEEIHKVPLESKQVALRKSYDKIKSKKHGFYDSLEDVCSLVSNIDKCSISCEVENDSNLNNKQHVVEDSLKNPLVAVANKSHAISDQAHFDDDSLAIIEYENTFDDSLEEINMLESIEEMDDIENVVVETQNIAVKVEQNSLFTTRNLFDTSVEIICEKKKVCDCADQEESSDDKNLLYDSLSNSDFKDVLKDSLEECKRPSEILSLLKNASIDITTDKENVVVENENIALKTEQNSIFASKNLNDTSVQFVCEKMKISKVADQEESSDDKNLFDSLSNSDFKDILKDSLEESQKSNENLGILKHVTDDDDDVIPKNIFSRDTVLETSIQIIYENSQNYAQNENNFEKTNSEYNDISKDSLENSENFHEKSAAQIKMKTAGKQNLLHSNINNALLLKDNFENFQKSNENLDLLKHMTDGNVMKPENIFSNQDALETSVHIINGTSQNCDQNKNIFENINSEYNNISKDSLENSENIYEKPVAQIKIKTATKQSLQHSNMNNTSLLTKDTPISQNYSENVPIYRDTILALQSDANSNLENKTMQNGSVVTENEVPSTTNGISTNTKENFSVDSCQLKILNNNANIDKDLKFQLQLEVTVGDKKCQINSQDIKIVPGGGQNSKIDAHYVPCISVGTLMNSEQYIVSKKETLHSSSQQLNTKNSVASTPAPSELYSNEKSRRKFTIEDTSNITLRRKSFTSQQFGNEDIKLDHPEHLSDVSLLQALDLHDISMSLLNESTIQSKDSLIPLNLCSRDQCKQKFHATTFKNENKENLPEQSHNISNKNFCVDNKNITPNKGCISKSPNKLQKCSSFKKTPGTKIPVRKIENFAVPVTPNKLTKELPTALSSEKIKKCQHSPHTVDGAKKTPGTTPNKIPHICKVRNTIFSKVPQIVPSKKYMNVQSPVAQYIKNYGAVKTPGFDPVLRDCMNRPIESPGHSHHQTPKGASLKPSKKKA